MSHRRSIIFYHELFNSGFICQSRILDVPLHADKGNMPPESLRTDVGSQSQASVFLWVRLVVSYLII